MTERLQHLFCHTEHEGFAQARAGKVPEVRRLFETMVETRYVREKRDNCKTMVDWANVIGLGFGFGLGLCWYRTQ